MKLRIHSHDRYQCPDLPEFFEWEPTVRDRKQAEANHSQTLERLNERGGLAWCELAAVLLGERYRARSPRDAAALCVRELATRTGVPYAQKA